jgi:serine/threonine protein kinase
LFVLCLQRSYGSVWRATHRKTGNALAIKRVPIENDIEDIVTETTFLKECKSPYVVRYYGSFLDKKRQELWVKKKKNFSSLKLFMSFGMPECTYTKDFKIVMEFCGVGSLSDLMNITNKTLSEAQIAVVLQYTLKGLEYLHGERKIHRDIKAGNILLNDAGEAKLGKNKKNNFYLVSNWILDMMMILTMKKQPTLVFLVRSRPYQRNETQLLGWLLLLFF